MLFNSVEYFVFLALVIPLYFIIPYRYRWIFLLIASYFFYMRWRWEYIFLIIISTLIDFIAGMNIVKSSPKGKKRWLIVSIISNLSLLFFFKYFNLFNRTFAYFFNLLKINYPVPDLDILLPVGISFYTFQSLSYTIDIYKGKLEPTRHLGKFMLFISFFPQLVAGPIERAKSLLPQLSERRNFDYNRFAHGSMLILWGLFKKVVIADNAAKYVDMVYANPSNFSGYAGIIATYCFAIQAYGDFSGYSDIAIGSAEILGVKLMQNFRRPYFARTFAEIWERWHISLSTWLRDYLYFSLGGSKKGNLRTVINIFITMFLGGIWHGANWTFVLWGLMVGLLIVLSRITEKYRNALFAKMNFPDSIRKIIQIIITFHLFCFTLVFFRSESFTKLGYMFKQIFTMASGLNYKIGSYILYTDTELLFLFISLLILFIVQIIQEYQNSNGLDFMYKWFPRPVRWIFYYAIILLIAIYGVDGSKAFIYFQF